MMCEERSHEHKHPLSWQTFCPVLIAAAWNRVQLDFLEFLAFNLHNAPARLVYVHVVET